jgi:hypothetical protein
VNIRRLASFRDRWDLLCKAPRRRKHRLGALRQWRLRLSERLGRVNFDLVVIGRAFENHCQFATVQQ